MDRLLLDTHVVLWALDDHPKLSLRARSAITNPANEVFVSAASIWEIAIKRSLGKLQAPDSITSWIEASGFLELPITSFHAEQAGDLPFHHRDPFDRMLVAQAQAEGLTLVTADQDIHLYGVRTMTT